jgi:hypothetical protein
MVRDVHETLVEIRVCSEGLVCTGCAKHTKIKNAKATHLRALDENMEIL